MTKQFEFTRPQCHKLQALKERRLRVWLCSFLLGFHWFLPAAHAEGSPSDDNVAAARSAFDEGLRHFRNAEFDAAVVDFETAFRLKPHPSALLDLGRAYAAAGRPLEAVQSLERYLLEGGSTLSAARRESVDDLLDAQKRRLATILVTCATPDVAVTIDGTGLGSAPITTTLVAPGKHTVIGKRSGFETAIVVIEVQAGESRDVALNLARLPEAKPAELVHGQPGSRSPKLSGAPARTEAPVLPIPNAFPRSNTHTVGAISLGIGFAAFAVGTYAAIRARDSWNERHQHCPESKCDDRAVEAWHSAQRSAFIADVSFATGVLTTAAGLYLIFSNRHDVPKPDSTTVALVNRSNGWVFEIGGFL